MRSVFVRPVRVSRATSTYAVHAYHTKVPVEAITPYILHYTRMGDTVLDPFCGSGMTGLSAALSGRKAILNDLSPAAVHIARNYTMPCDPSALEAVAERLLNWAKPQIEPLYEVSCPTCSGPARTEYVVWSDLRACPTCSTAVNVWEARGAEGGVRALSCPGCGAEFDKNSAMVVGELPVSINLSCPGCGLKRIVVAPRSEDLAKAAYRREAVPYWYPELPFGPDWEMWRGGHRDLGITNVADFWSSRNLAALSVLFEGVGREPDDRLREALKFIFTAIVNRASRRYQWNAKRPTNVLGGTLYIASLRYEWNVLSLFGRKLRATTAFYRNVQVPPGAVTVVNGSAANLRAVPAKSLPYIFTDPPFGANIYYADASLLWEAWLGSLTDRREEAVVSHRREGKSLIDYQDLMARSFAEMKRCVATDGTITMVFQNTDDRVWKAIREAATDAGLHVLGATTLHKSQPSFKGIKASQAGERVAATDVVMTMAGHVRDKQAVTEGLNAVDVVSTAIEREMRRGGGERLASTAHMYAVAVSALVDVGLATDGWDFDRVADLVGAIARRASPSQLSLGID